ncbi:MAG: hypothetical protein GSR80_000040 [Desulfurococcales archaeon]|nr:hypothetical protein [Desulfurococcales archaeon]
MWPLLIALLGALGAFFMMHESASSGGLGEFWALLGLGGFMLLLLVGLGLFVREVRGK